MSGRWGLGWAGAAVAVVAAAAPCAPLAAQSIEEVLAQRRLEYRAAREAYEAATSAFSVVERDFAAALEAIDRAKASGDGDALERAYRVAQDRSVPMRQQEQRVSEAADVLAESRDRLIEIITIRLGSLIDEMDAASSAAQRNRLDALWRDLRNELEALEAEAGGRLSIMPVVFPEVSFDPRDGPDELTIKAELLERRAAMTDTLILEVEDEIRALEDRMRIERQRRDFIAGTDRFDDVRAPGVGVRANDDPTVAATDTTGAAGRPLSLEERLERARLYRDQLEDYRDQVLVRARQFRGRVRAIT